jgi:hypothetical protein
MAKKKTPKRRPKRAAKKAAKPKKGRRAKRATSPQRKAAPGRRSNGAPRVRPRTGPVQMGLPLQMPLALGREAFAERPVPVDPAAPDAPGGADDGAGPAPAEQAPLFE